MRWCFSSSGFIAACRTNVQHYFTSYSTICSCSITFKKPRRLCSLRVVWCNFTRIYNIFIAVIEDWCLNWTLMCLVFCRRQAPNRKLDTCNDLCCHAYKKEFFPDLSFCIFYLLHIRAFGIKINITTNTQLLL